MPVYSGTVGSAGGNYEALFDGHGPEAWTDINPNSFFKDPNIFIPSAEVTLSKEDQDLWDLYKRPREVIYTEIHNNITFKYRLSLVFLVMPAGATAVTLSSAVGTYETAGKILGNDGVLGVTGANHSNTAGISLGKYFSLGVDTVGEAAIGEYAVTSLASDAFSVGSLTAGDGIWVIRSGRCAVLPDVNIVVDDKLCFGATGLVSKAAVSGGSTVIAEVSDIGGDSFVGTALSSGTSALFCLADIYMPERYGDEIEASGVVDASPET
tara:strand:- start:2318 stop:3118 length:801 start_codon:yes stop_codon:yes gene_type:complete